MTAEYFINNPDYTLQWPPELFAAELNSLYRRGVAGGIDHAWEKEVTRLLEEAFVSSVPARDFRQKCSKRYDDEPF